MGVSASVDDNGQFGANPMSTTAQASFSDRGLHLADATQSGILQFVFSADGTADLEPISGSSAVTVTTVLYVNNTSTESKDEYTACFTSACGGIGPINYSKTVISDPFQIAAGSSFSFGAAIQLNASMIGNGFTAADFSHTVKLTDITFTDAAGNPIGGASLIDGSGNIIPLNQSLAAVPEPQTVGLLGLAVATIVGVQARRRPRRLPIPSA
jgi:hypothetical protein